MKKISLFNTSSNLNKTKAAILFSQKKPLKIIDLNIPKKLEKGQVLVKIISSAICGAQIGEISGIKGKDKWLPHCLGHEGFGIVIKKNSKVKNLKVGDQVIMHWRKGKGLNAKPSKYKSLYGNIGAGQITTFQEIAIVSENRLTKIDKFYNYSIIAPLLGCAFPTAWGILNKETVFNQNNKILIFGAGGIGLTIGCIAKIQKSSEITLVDKYLNKIKFVKKLGLNFSKLQNIKHKKFDLVIDTTGDTNIISDAFDRVQKNGSLVLVGQPKKGTILKIKNPLRLFNHPSDHIKIITSDGGNFYPQYDMLKLIKLVKKNFSYLKKIITHVISLNDINKGINLIKKGKAARVLIKN